MSSTSQPKGRFYTRINEQDFLGITIWPRKTTMLSALVELLEGKEILTQEEWEKKIESKIARAKGLHRYRDVQFDEK